MVKLSVSGMNCGACVRKITQSVHAIDQNARVDVDLAATEARIEGLNHDRRLEKAIQALGYGAQAG